MNSRQTETDTTKLAELIEARAMRWLSAALDDNPAHTHNRLHAAQMAASLYTCLSHLRTQEAHNAD